MTVSELFLFVCVLSFLCRLRTSRLILVWGGRVCIPYHLFRNTSGEKKFTAPFSPLFDEPFYRFFTHVAITSVALSLSSEQSAFLSD